MSHEYYSEGTSFPGDGDSHVASFGPGGMSVPWGRSSRWNANSPTAVEPDPEQGRTRPCWCCSQQHPRPHGHDISFQDEQSCYCCTYHPTAVVHDSAFQQVCYNYRSVDQRLPASYTQGQQYPSEAPLPYYPHGEETAQFNRHAPLFEPPAMSVSI